MFTVVCYRLPQPPALGLPFVPDAARAGARAARAARPARLLHRGAAHEGQRARGESVQGPADGLVALG